MTWTVELDPSVEKELNSLDSKEAKRILRFLFERIVHLENPRSIGEALKGSQLNMFWKYRVGDYRIISSIEDNRKSILVVRVGNRREIYR